MSDSKIHAIRMIDVKYKAKWKNLHDQLGRNPTTADKEYWVLSEWYREEMTRFVSDRARERVVASGEIVTRETVGDDGETVEVEYQTSEDRKCEVCWGVLYKKAGRGRWPKRCEGCKAGVNVPTNERDDDER